MADDEDELYEHAKYLGVDLDKEPQFRRWELWGRGCPSHPAENGRAAAAWSRRRWTRPFQRAGSKPRPRTATCTTSISDWCVGGSESGSLFGVSQALWRRWAGCQLVGAPL